MNVSATSNFVQGGERGRGTWACVRSSNVVWDWMGQDAHLLLPTELIEGVKRLLLCRLWRHDAERRLLAHSGAPMKLLDQAELRRRQMPLTRWEAPLSSAPALDVCLTACPRVSVRLQESTVGSLGWALVQCCSTDC